MSWGCEGERDVKTPAPLPVQSIIRLRPIKSSLPRRFFAFSGKQNQGTFLNRRRAADNLTEKSEVAIKKKIDGHFFCGFDQIKFAIKSFFQLLQNFGIESFPLRGKVVKLAKYLLFAIRRASLVRTNSTCTVCILLKMELKFQPITLSGAILCR